MIQGGKIHVGGERGWLQRGKVSAHPFLVRVAVECIEVNRSVRDDRSLKLGTALRGRENYKLLTTDVKMLW